MLATNTSWMFLIAHWVVSALALWLTAAVVPGFRLKGFLTAMVASLLIAAGNFWLRPILWFFTLPFTIITLGLFTFVLDAIILRISAAFLKDFEISGWLSAIAGAFVLMLASGLLHFVFV